MPSESPSDLWEMVLVFVGIFTFIPPLMMSIQVLRLSKPDRVLKTDDSLRELFQRILPTDFMRWISERGLQFLGGLRMDAVEMVVWLFPDRLKTLVIYRIQGRIVFEFVSALPESGALDTSNMKDTQMFPAVPGCYKEALKLNRPDDLLAAHEATLTLLRDRRGLNPIPLPPEDIRTIICDAIRRDMANVRSHFLWPLRALDWYYIRRHRWYGVSVEEQFCRGWSR